MTLLGLVLNLSGSFFLLFAQPKLTNSKELGCLKVELASNPKVFWYLGIALMLSGFICQAIPLFLQWKT